MLRKKLNQIIAVTLIAISGVSVAQEMNGFIPGNYSGITGSLINPSSILNSKLYLDINLAGIHVNADNNYIYLAADEYKFMRFFDFDADYPEHTDEVSGDTRNFYDWYNTDRKNVFSQVRVMGPSVMFALGHHAFGLSTAYRVMASGSDVPYDIAKFAVEGLDYRPQQRINFINNSDFGAGALAMAEVAATYSRILYRRNQEHWSGGITIKGLFGTGGAYLYSNDVDYLVPNNDTLIVYNANASMGISAPLDFSDNDVLLPGNLFQGSGLGFDIGITYQKKMRGHSPKVYSAPCEIPYQPYYYSIGASLIDLGKVNFNRNLRTMQLENASARWYDMGGNDYATADELFRTISYEFSGDSSRLLEQEAFSVGLPTAISLQGDIHLKNEFYVNATWVHPVRLYEAQVMRPAQLAITPRFESHYFEVSLPLTLYNYNHPRVGLSARFHNVIVGTDKLGGFFGLSDFEGIDLYIMVKLQFERGNCLRFKKKFGCGNLEYLQKY